MFSDNYKVSDKYSIFNKEYISTTETMPWKYTSLYDSQYLPELPENVVDKLNCFFRYRFLHTTHALYDSEKNLSIEHKDGDIISYEILNLFPYHIINETTFFWKHFTSTIQCPEIDICRDKINLMTDETDNLCTFITHIKYDSECNFDSIAIFDRSYNLSDYPASKTLEKLNQFVKNNYDDFRGVIYFNHQNNELNYRMLINFPSVDIYYDSETILPNDGTPEEIKVISHTNKEHRDTYIPYLVENAILTEEQAEYVNSVVTDNCRFDLEFSLDETGEVKDIFIHNIKIYEFENLQGG